MAALPRVLVELKGGTVTRIVSDDKVQVITVDTDEVPPTIGLTVSDADVTLTREAMDRLLDGLIGKVRTALMSDNQN